MANSLITCAYTLTAVGAQPIATLAARFAAVPLDLAIPQLVGLLPVEDLTAPPSGQSVTRTVQFRMTPLVAGAAFMTIVGSGFGPVRQLVLTTPGVGYAKPPLVTLGTPGEDGRAHARGNVTSGIVLNGGSGYSPATTVTIVGGEIEPGGTVATATPNIAGGIITGVTITSHGDGYQSYPTLVFSDTGGGSGAYGVGTLEIENLVIDFPGDGYTPSTPVTLTPVFPVSFPDSSQAAGGGQAQVLAGWMLQEFQQALQTSNVVAAAPVVS